VTIEILEKSIDGYAVKVDDEIMLECLSEKEVVELTIGELAELQCLLSMEPSMN